MLNEGLYHYQINDGSSVRNYGPRNLRDFLYTTTFRRQLAEDYGWADEEQALDNWVVLNARNQLVTAASARAPSWGTRMANIGAILEAEPIRSAYESLIKQPVEVNRRILKEVRVAYRMPVLYTLFYWSAKRLQRLLRGGVQSRQSKSGKI